MRRMTVDPSSTARPPAPAPEVAEKDGFSATPYRGFEEKMAFTATPRPAVYGKTGCSAVSSAGQGRDS